MLSRMLPFVSLCALLNVSQGALVTAFNFNSYDGNSSTIASSSGVATITLEEDGVAWDASRLDNPAGTTVNAVGADPAGTSLSLGHTANTSVTRTMTVQVSTLGFSDLMLSFASAGPNSTFNNADLTYSLNGINYIDPMISFDPAAGGSFGTVTQDLSGINAIENQATTFLRLTLSSQNLAPFQNLRIDNLQINAMAAVPEARSLSIVGMAFVSFGLIGLRRRRKAMLETAATLN